MNKLEEFVTGKTIEDLPEELRNLQPGEVVFLQKKGEETENLQRIAEYLEREIFSNVRGLKVNIRFLETEENSLANSVFARRLNIGAIESYCLIVGTLENVFAIEAFCSSYSNVRSMNSEPIELAILEDDYYNGTSCEAISRKEDSRELDEPIRESGCFRYVKSYEKADDFLDEDSIEECEVVGKNLEDSSSEIEDEKKTYCSKSSQSITSHSIIIPHEDDQEIINLEIETAALAEKISMLIVEFVNKYHQMPPMERVEELLKGKILLGNDGLSRLVVNKDLKIILPSYNEIEVPMRPLMKTIYILFLKHPEGIVLKEIDTYRDEMEDIYSLLMPNKDDKKVKSSIEVLANPIYNDSLRQQLSKIKRVIKSKIMNEETARHYYVEGERGGKYLISLDRNLVDMPNALQ